ncbi:hypothetical protein DXV75_07990 [Alteromonas aestuariivivens]|uniref:Lipoprotein n=1 Tax=Alteromonas aestuariivivens TaxID=1938339 RepID=A0A3D8M857_9ALTE|nr:DUF6279 family lipoprotein [Alteromonas aestuariivivens]RDV26017.1 hypothetical protein DXV75_07990 [Alteromonas aestuariivivens]
MKIWFKVAFLILLVTGCSSKLAYNNLDWLVYWYLDDYVELNDAQESLFDTHLQNWISWHRTEELSRYITHLKSLRNDIESGSLNEERLQWHMNEATQHWARIREELSPELAKFALTLSDDQIVRMFAALENDNREEEEKWQDKQDDSAEKRLAKRKEEFYDSFKQRIGRLTDEQKAIIDKYVTQFVSTHLHWIEYRRAVQSEARRIFATRNYSEDAFIASLQALMTDPDAYRSEEYTRVRQQNNQWYTQMAAELASSLTAKQKRKLIDEISDIISDLSELLDDN